MNIPLLRSGKLIDYRKKKRRRKGIGKETETSQGWGVQVLKKRDSKINGFREKGQEVPPSRLGRRGRRISKVNLGSRPRDGSQCDGDSQKKAGREEGGGLAFLIKKKGRGGGILHQRKQ